MPSIRTEVTEIVTGLGCSGHDDLDAALTARAVANVGDEVWARLEEAVADPALRFDVAASWANGRALLAATDGLRGRPPLLVEWKGPTRAPGDEVAPVDLRVDHVYLISCKYLSKVLANSSPTRLFDRCLATGGERVAPDWFSEVAPAQHQELFAVVRHELGARAALPPNVVDLTPTHRAELRDYLRAGWSDDARAAYVALAGAVSAASAARWKASLRSKAQAEALLWRLLRIGSAPYFVLGAQRDRSLRLRVMTPWDWRQAFELRRFDVWADDAGQPQVRWRAEVRDRAGGPDRVVDGHVEVRWSHGRFGQPPEAKAYLDTPHHRVPGYVALT
jgi:hypothetical protein